MCRTFSYDGISYSENMSSKVYENKNTHTITSVQLKKMPKKSEQTPTIRCKIKNENNAIFSKLFVPWSTEQFPVRYQMNLSRWQGLVVLHIVSGALTLQNNIATSRMLFWTFVLGIQIHYFMFIIWHLSFTSMSYEVFGYYIIWM